MIFNVGMVSLGCAKNLVDSEVMLGLLENNGFQVTNNPAEAEILVVNTCGFIESAKEESIEAILEMAGYKENGRCRYLVVAGCMAQKYRTELLAEMPEIDLLIGPGQLDELVPLLQEKMGGMANCFGNEQEWPDVKFIYDANTPRKLATPSYMAYIKIAEGCDNRCAFCQIPFMRGGYRSRIPEDIREEVSALAGRNIKEINFIAQDTTAYGHDLAAGYTLAGLMRSLEDIDGPVWYRLLYTYPTRITDELVQIIKSSRKICRYLDIPLQHADDGILKAMNRCGDEKFYREVIQKLRREIPGIALRSTFIVGFPGETEASFERLLNFVQEMQLDHIGVFEYSQEEGTPAAEMFNQVPDAVKKQRKATLMKAQLNIVRSKNKSKIGQTIDVLVEGKSSKNSEVYVGRTQSDAPDIDGKVFFTGGLFQPGDLVPVRITRARDYDLMGVRIN